MFAVSSKSSRKQICQSPMSIPIGGFGMSVPFRKYVEIVCEKSSMNAMVDSWWTHAKNR
jgi:hypothetical protein